MVLFWALRLPAAHRPYHQDEYEWIDYAHPEITAPGAVPHPPLTEFIYAKTLGPLLGDNNFRFIPLIFSFVNLLLVFYLAKIIFDKKTAFWTAFLFTVSFYSILASLMVDVDGAVMPAFFLIMVISYFRLISPTTELSLNTRSPDAPLPLSRRGWMGSEASKWVWATLLVIGAVGGFLIKISGILPIAAIFLDFLIERRIFSDKRKILKYFGFGVLGLLTLTALLFAAKFIFPFFNLEYSFNYWKHFANSSSFFGRGWLQTFIQFAKSILYTSPLLLLPIFFISKDVWHKIRPFFLFIFIGLFFYLFVFDFSIGALDRYFQFLIIPLCIISGAIFVKWTQPIVDFNVNVRTIGVPLLSPRKGKSWSEMITPIIFSFLILLIQFFNHYTPPLYPKTEWISKILSFKWNFLYPFSGGSGPLPFYISFAFMALIWIYSLALVIPSFVKNNFKKQALIGIFILGLTYNAIFIEEYLFGKINGSAPVLVKNATAFIKNNDTIKKVTVYNDNGGFNLMEIGKYRKRLYIDPKFDINKKVLTLNKYKEHYLVIDIPHIDASTVYQRYFNSCKIIYNQIDKEIRAIIYDCRNAPDLKL